MTDTTPDQGDERRAEAYIAAHDAFNSALPAGLRGHSEWCDRFDAARAAFDRAFVMSHPEYAEAGKGACDHSQKEIVSYWACVECGHVPAFDSVPSSQQREPQEAAEPWEDGNGVIRNGVLPDAPQEAGKPAWKCADRLNDCRELCGSSQCFSKEAGKVEPVADEPFGWFSAFRDGSEDFMRRTDSQPAPAYEEEPTHCIALYAHPSPQALSDEEIQEADYSLLSDLASIDCWETNLRDQPSAYVALERYRAILAAAGGGEK